MLKVREKVKADLVSQEVECLNGHRATLRSYDAGDGGWFLVYCDCGALWLRPSETTTKQVECEIGRPFPEVASVEYRGHGSPPGRLNDQKAPQTRNGSRGPSRGEVLLVRHPG